MPRSRSFRTQGIILKRRDMGEADRLVTLLTPDYGKLDAIAKGARKPASTKTGHVELFTLTDVLISKGREIDILVQSETKDHLLPLREDLNRGAYASYVVELLDRFSYDQDEYSEEIFDLLYQTLHNISEADDLALVTRHYELALLDDVGFRPELNYCVISRETIQPVDQFFSYAQGGVVTPAVAHQATGLVRIPVDTLKVLRYLQRSSYLQIQNLELNDALHQDLERIMLGYIAYILERKLQSISFIERLRQQTK